MTNVGDSPRRIRSLPPPAADPAGITTREQRRLETRERIFEAALEEFQREGVARAQIDRIVEAAGVARGTFYFHFPTKEHVLVEMQRRYEASIVDSLRVMPRPDSLAAFLREVVRACTRERALSHDPLLTREIMAMYVRAQPASTEPAAFPILLTVADFLTEAAERGDIRSDIPPEELATLFLISMFGFFITAIDEAEERQSQFDAAIDIFVRGIQA